MRVTRLSAWFLRVPGAAFAPLSARVAETGDALVDVMQDWQQLGFAPIDEDASG